MFPHLWCMYTQTEFYASTFENGLSAVFCWITIMFCLADVFASNILTSYCGDCRILHEWVDFLRTWSEYQRTIIFHFGGNSPTLVNYTYQLCMFFFCSCQSALYADFLTCISGLYICLLPFFLFFKDSLGFHLKIGNWRSTCGRHVVQYLSTIFGGRDGAGLVCYHSVSSAVVYCVANRVPFQIQISCQKYTSVHFFLIPDSLAIQYCL